MNRHTFGCIFFLCFLIAGIHGFFGPKLSLQGRASSSGRQNFVNGRKMRRTSSHETRRKTIYAMIDLGDLSKDPPSESVLKAVEAAGCRVTGADISSTVGLSLAESQAAVSTLALLTSGSLQVSSEGEIVYVFDRNFRNILRARHQITLINSKFFQI